jgi:hypothetical protein
LCKGKDVAGILFQDANIGLDKREVYLIEDEDLNCDSTDINLEPQGVETYGPFFISGTRKSISSQRKIYALF